MAFASLQRPYRTVRRLLRDPRGEAAAVAEEVFRATVTAMSGDLVDEQQFRDTMSAFPAAVCIVTALDETGYPRGLACSAVASLSVDPPLLLICVNRRNGSLRAIRHSGGFCVNLLRSGRSEISDRFASPSPDKFSGVTWRPSPVSGLPWLSTDTTAYVDCQLAAEIEAGTHAILVGNVRDASPVGTADQPLLYWKRSYGTWQNAAPTLAVVR
jgi:flavin reductase (DIM6/NTAB) family NADH-FMN oxidoreductase RutF